ncbi:hypothetical protein ACNRWW_20345 [Metabacillus sp. HB246100]|uniref:hypothetical protein n=1 Tax=Bacillus weihaiensis TaxID=1547283 RepID=UPI0023552C6C|nr:hypothetical protein [Bacillus weihaiensis]
MLIRIVVAIIAGGMMGFISCLFIASAVNAPDSSLVYSTYFGVVSGLLICLIMEVSKLDSKRHSN